MSHAVPSPLIILVSLDAAEYVIKAQVLAGGRGKGVFSSGLRGGVQLTRDPERIASLSQQMIGHRLVTHQTGPDGVLVKRIMIAEAKDLAQETYFAIVLDRSVGGPVLVGSPLGGVDIEGVAAEQPQMIFKERINPRVGPTSQQLERLARSMRLAASPAILEQATNQMARLYQLFTATDATQVEVNPLGVTPTGEVLCFDAKINFDDNAAYRQPQLFSQQQRDQADLEEGGDKREARAAAHNFNYVPLDGSIGCLVNGAGLAMATMDILQLHGGAPANFLDVGGASQHPDQIAAAFRLLLEDEGVKSIFVNIFGGIVRCDLIAEGILQAVKEGRPGETSISSLRCTVPLVIRLAGTNEEAARVRLMKEYPGPIEIYPDLDAAAKAAVAQTLPKKDATVQ